MEEKEWSGPEHIVTSPLAHCLVFWIGVPEICSFSADSWGQASPPLPDPLTPHSSPSTAPLSHPPS